MVTVGDWNQGVRIGHPSGVMKMYPSLVQNGDSTDVPGVAVQRTARRIMDGMVYIRD
ncbi:PrpF domain-containing protein [Klebsiella pneumoniae]|nr:PrpF domain-containing protein [Klebsiella pneumoniae]MDP1288150.1 PrpF domain-containing protein [Klebsiella pneumoniae]